MAYQYNLQNMNWSGTYLRSVLSSDVLTKLLTITTLNSSWTEVFMTTMITMMVNCYEALESTLTHKKILGGITLLGEMLLTYVHQLFLIYKGWIVLERLILITWLIFPGSWINTKTQTSIFGKWRNIRKSLLLRGS